MQPPYKRNRAIALVTNVCRVAQARNDRFVSQQSTEQQDPRSLRDVMDVSLAGRTIGRGGALALPVNEFGADRIVAVARGRREAADTLIESEGESVGLRSSVPPDAGLPCRWLCPVANAEGSKRLASRVPSVHVQRDVPAGSRERCRCAVGRSAAPNFDQFRPHLRMRPDLLESSVHRVRLAQARKRTHQHPQVASLPLG